MKKINKRLLALVIPTALILVQITGKSVANEVVDDGFDGLAIMANDNLEGIRAGDFDVITTVQGVQELKTTLTGGDFNATHIVNGDIVFRDNAFSQFNGIGLVVGNTGNNSAINAALGVTFHLE